MDENHFCYVCGSAWGSEKEFKEHFLLHLLGGSYSCGLCRICFQFPGDLQDHLLSHTKAKPFVCSDCGEGFSKRQELQTHICGNGNSMSREKMLVCGICSAASLNLDDLQQHLLSHDLTKPYSCAICSEVYVKISDLRVHVVTHKRTVKFLCKLCRRRFSSKNVLFNHRFMHFSEKNHKCKVCSKAYRHSSALQLHLQKHSNVHACEVCGDVLHTSALLKHHMLSHSLTCKECGQIFYLRSHFQRHLATHAAFSCSFCQKGFKNSNTFKIHMIRHTGKDRPYSCSFCLHKFRSVRRFELHYAQHFKQKAVYKCGLCPKIFSIERCAQKHREKHNKHNLWSEKVKAAIEAKLQKFGVHDSQKSIVQNSVSLINHNISHEKSLANKTCSEADVDLRSSAEGSEDALGGDHLLKTVRGKRENQQIKLKNNVKIHNMSRMESSSQNVESVLQSEPSTYPEQKAFSKEDLQNIRLTLCNNVFPRMSRPAEVFDFGTNSDNCSRMNVPKCILRKSLNFTNADNSCSYHNTKREYYVCGVCYKSFNNTGTFFKHMTKYLILDLYNPVNNHFQICPPEKHRRVHPSIKRYECRKFFTEKRDIEWNLRSNDNPWNDCPEFGAREFYTMGDSFALANVHSQTLGKEDASLPAVSDVTEIKTNNSSKDIFSLDNVHVETYFENLAINVKVKSKCQSIMRYEQQKKFENTEDKNLQMGDTFCLKSFRTVTSISSSNYSVNAEDSLRDFPSHSTPSSADHAIKFGLNNDHVDRENTARTSSKKMDIALKEFDRFDCSTKSPRKRSLKIKFYLENSTEDETLFEGTNDAHQINVDFGINLMTTQNSAANGFDFASVSDFNATRQKTVHHETSKTSSNCSKDARMHISKIAMGAGSPLHLQQENYNNLEKRISSGSECCLYTKKQTETKISGSTVKSTTTKNMNVANINNILKNLQEEINDVSDSNEELSHNFSAVLYPNDTLNADYALVVLQQQIPGLCTGPLLNINKNTEKVLPKSGMNATLEKFDEQTPEVAEEANIKEHTTVGDFQQRFMEKFIKEAVLLSPPKLRRERNRPELVSATADKLFFSCEICEKKFLIRHNMMMHLKSHFRERQSFVCEVCGQNFDRLSAIKRHMLNHKYNLFDEETGMNFTNMEVCPC